MMEDELAKFSAELQELKDMKAAMAEQEREEQRKKAQRLLDIHNRNVQRNEARQERRIKALLEVSASQANNNSKPREQQASKKRQRKKTAGKLIEGQGHTRANSMVSQNQLLDDTSII